MKFAVTLFALLIVVPAFADNAIDDKVAAAQAAESRPQADIDRDKNRRPLETLKFFGLKDDMKVLELIPGGGWYTRILAPGSGGKWRILCGDRYWTSSRVDCRHGRL